MGGVLLAFSVYERLIRYQPPLLDPCMNCRSEHTVHSDFDLPHGPSTISKRSVPRCLALPHSLVHGAPQTAVEVNVLSCALKSRSYLALDHDAVRVLAAMARAVMCATLAVYCRRSDAVQSDSTPL